MQIIVDNLNPSSIFSYINLNIFISRLEIGKFDLKFIKMINWIFKLKNVQIKLLDEEEKDK